MTRQVGGENCVTLIRNDLIKLERARHLKRRKAIYETQDKVMKHGGDRKSNGGVRHLMLPTFTTDTPA